MSEIDTRILGLIRKINKHAENNLLPFVCLPASCFHSKTREKHGNPEKLNEMLEFVYLPRNIQSYNFQWSQIEAWDENNLEERSNAIATRFEEYIKDSLLKEKRDE